MTGVIAFTPKVKSKANINAQTAYTWCTISILITSVPSAVLSYTWFVLHKEYYHAHKCEHPKVLNLKWKKYGIYSWSLITVWFGILFVSHPSHYCAVLLFISELVDMIKMQKNAELWIAVSALTTGQWSHGCSCSHNTRMQRHHICTNPWEPVLKYTYSFIFYDWNMQTWAQI